MPDTVVLLLPSNDVYGASRTSMAVARELDRRGARVVLAVPEDGPLRAALSDTSVEVKVIPCPVLRRQRLRENPVVAVWKLGRDARAMWAQWPKTVTPSHIHAFCLPTLGGLLLSLRYRDAHLSWSVHEYVSGHVERLFFKALIAKADQRMACSQYIRTSMGLSSRRCTVVYSGAGLTSPDSGQDQWPLESRAGHLRVICVGRLNRWKGQEVLIRAVASAREAGVLIQLVLVGSTFTTDVVIERELRELARELELNDRVAFVGELPNAEGMMRAADVVVVPSTKPEPFGKVVVEAMCLAKPVIATTPGGPAEVIRDGVDGILVASGSVAELADALVRLTDREMRDRLGRSGLSRADKFSNRMAATGYADLILEAV